VNCKSCRSSQRVSGKLSGSAGRAARRRTGNSAGPH
jgi:hypothetical protein